ncbi:MAG: hypothetical protein Ct9H90mP16_03560 [Candidatus Poseidoniales archaeon]|nr:MAG: hypothetical protein Ct9H90mP16_03560 [Candidatus Poseidoniales archaeon]
MAVNILGSSGSGKGTRGYVGGLVAFGSPQRGERGFMALPQFARLTPSNRNIAAEATCQAIRMLGHHVVH